MANSNRDHNERAELEREREDPEISPAQPLGPDRIDAGEDAPAAGDGPAPHTKAEDGPRMRH